MCLSCSRRMRKGGGSTLDRGTLPKKEREERQHPALVERGEERKPHLLGGKRGPCAPGDSQTQSGNKREKNS